MLSKQCIDTNNNDVDADNDLDDDCVECIKYRFTFSFPVAPQKVKNTFYVCYRRLATAYSVCSIGIYWMDIKKSCDIFILLSFLYGTHHVSNLRNWTWAHVFSRTIIALTKISNIVTAE